MPNTRFLSTKLLRIFLIASLVSLPILYLAQTIISQANPNEVEDFIIFYTAGSIARRDGFDKVYDLERQAATQAQILGKDLNVSTMLVYNHLPSLTPIFYVLSLLEYRWAALIWKFFLLGLYGFSTVYLLKEAVQIEQQIRPFLTAGILLFYPVYVGLYHGQDTAFLFLGLTLWYIGEAKKHETLSLIGLLLTTFRPHISAGILLAYALAHPKQFWKLIGLGAVWAAINIAIVGVQGARDFLRILSLSAEGTQLRMSDSAMLNLLGLLTRAFPSAPTSLLRSMSWAGFLAGVLLCFFVWRQAERSAAWKMSLNILAALFFAPHLHYHDLAITAIPLVFVISQNYTLMQKTLLTGIFPLFSLVTLLTPAWYQIWPYLLYLALWIALWRTPSRKSLTMLQC
ncbi:MAG: hypothetical protein Fur0043_03010 [Anaerolineales bacterium]